ncbi:hypothetical protein COCC4DRAFT_56097 [Bipolaris maydis ATCC 48331]|uniref:SWR1-complex protein 3 domain-containing protein n=2 Tax=Cochliobolus heterostrophus TaxID=5016 RepID=M2U849_COCH5|nr:uncharacterized protein COCC4DRAFT_56097 [Bipolaris maydis ATCC 48331]EMD89926.1 hypothetical protein COCHEDRAFT_1178043 [Bipolaris maydis C5]KAH7563228.1 hypothetical protein BM1_00275 [Bipolaris maydis]ENI09862.1 hypothetical protein COCC4DRAFT_56097 [Bipolaris maydis ATCC 48331]KAJ5025388.1 hypothetical protein J3E73DRAFT_413436 [Bipolaris maydis]KAJ6207756.1 hypothetical protein PSV09DRAFT_1178043 [Bipolaris maydis]
MSEPRRSTRARAREEAAPPAKPSPSLKKRKRTAAAASEQLSLPPSASTPGPPAAAAAALSTPPATERAPLPPKQPALPLRIVDGAPLPTLSEPQPLDLPCSEWQTIQQSGVLETSFERSKAVWLSGANFRTFHSHFTQPKKLADRTDEDRAKAQRQKELLKNFPQVGADRVVVKLVIEPHTLPIRLYGPREVAKPMHKKTPAPSPYAPWPAHHHHPHSHAQHQKYHHVPPPLHQKPPPRPPQPQPPKPVQVAPPPPAPPAPSPAPDPVIHMLAARAGTDPALKAVMKIVAAGEASKEQLEFFQTHINELTAILARQKEEKMSKPAPPPPAPKPALPPPPPAPPKQTAPPPLPRPVQPMPQPIQPNTPKSYTPGPSQVHMQQQQPPPPPLYQPHPPYPNNYSKPPQYHPPPQVPVYNPPPRTTYRPLVFSFVHGNEDKFYFPSYSFMEWLPNGTGAKLSFLITKMKPKPKPEPVVEPPSTPAPKATPAPAPTPTPVPASSAPAPSAHTPAAPTPGPAPPNGMAPTPNSSNPTFTSIQPAASAPPTPATPATPFVPPKPPQRIEEFDEMNEIDNIEFYQPVTVLLLIENDDGDEIASALPRSIRPPHIVEKYMNEVFDRCKRADETYLAFRLPRSSDEVPEKRLRSGDVTPAIATPVQDVNMTGTGAATASAADRKKAGRPRKSLV